MHRPSSVGANGRQGGWEGGEGPSAGVDGLGVADEGKGDRPLAPGGDFEGEGGSLRSDSLAAFQKKYVVEIRGNAVGMEP